MRKLLNSLMTGIMLSTAVVAYAASDSDYDGVSDDQDLCPNTPRNVFTNPQGCAADSDSDGLPDALDRCPGTRAGAVIDRYGCDVDKDGDGVVDDGDICPGTPAGAKVNTGGCSTSQTVVLKGVNFRKGSAILTPESSVTLDDAARKLRAHPELRVEVAGHTDNLGKPSVNEWLSHNRADAVRAYLVRAGVTATKLKAKGYGPTQPIASNDTEEGRAANRRVELHILE